MGNRTSSSNKTKSTGDSEDARLLRLTIDPGCLRSNGLLGDTWLEAQTENCDLDASPYSRHAFTTAHVALGRLGDSADEAIIYGFHSDSAEDRQKRLEVRK